MASEIRVDKITSLSGVGTISPSPTGVEIAGITTVTTLKATTGIVTTLTATTGIVTTFEATIGNITTLRAPTGIVTTLTTNTLTANSTTKVGSGITLSPDGDIFTTGITTFTDDVQFIGDSGISSITYDKSANQLNFVDNAKARFGSGGDLNIFHNGVASFIKNDTGALRIPTSIFKVRNAADNEDQIVTNQNGSVELFHDNTRRFQTTGAGISVSQISGGFSEFHHAGSNSGIRIAGPAGASGANLVFANNYDNSTNDEWAIQLDGATDDLLFKEGGHSGNERLRILETGGITFGGDTATANALDDYEEGTWTPTVTQGTIAYESAHYTKIGRMVNLSARVQTFSNRTSTSAIDIEGLPFTVSDAVNIGSSVFYRVAHTDEGQVASMVTGSSRVRFLVSSQGGSESWFYLQYNDLNNTNSQIRFNLWYLT